ncbi:MAG: hypothetical protein D9C04_00465 [Nitrosopumilus sp. B06]|nr:MAG: hypothetical protein D9C04_00465 [Nitrosopumilus sp. B06]
MQTVSKIRKEIKIVNTVSTATLGQKVNIASFNKYKHLSTDLDLYRCGYVKDDKMTGRVTIFGNGKMISVGTKSSKDSFQELENSKKIMQKYKLINSCKLDPQVRNIVATVDFARPLHIESLARTIPKSMYEPEQFPGLIHRIRDSIVSLIFASGKVVIVGSKSFEDLNYAYFHLNQFFDKMK